MKRKTLLSGRRAPIAAGSLGSAILLSLPLVAAVAPGLETPNALAQEPETETVRGEGGFEKPVRVLPEIGLWVDALTELGYAEKAGLLFWWGFGPPAPDADARYREIDWSRIAFRIRAEVFDADGRSVARQQRIVEPFRDDEFRAEGGFPTPMHLLMEKSGTYRARVEAYPLIDPESAGLDSIPRGAVERSAVLAEELDTSPEWLISDVLFLNSLEKWTVGGDSDRTWYEWFILPNAARSFAPDSAGAYVAFEIQRGEELFPRCGQNNCRVIISVIDDEGGLHLQTLRSVPDPNKVSAYVVPIETIDLEPGGYRTEIDIMEGSERILGVTRGFAMRSVGD